MLASRFRVLCADVGLSIDAAAKLLHVTPRTVRYWFSGQTAVPYSAYRLVRLMRCMELPPPFTDWRLHSGRIWTPEGYGFAPEDGGWWSLLVRQARCFRSLYTRSAAFERALVVMTPEGRAAFGLAPMAGGSDGLHAADALARGRVQAGRPDPASAAGRAAEPPAVDLSLGHFGTDPRWNAASSADTTVQTSSKGALHG